MYELQSTFSERSKTYLKCYLSFRTTIPSKEGLRAVLLMLGFPSECFSLKLVHVIYL